MPCGLPNDRDRPRNPPGTEGLAGLGIWWRSMRNEKDAIDILYHAAIRLGFKETIEDFSKAYHAGFKDEYSHNRNILVGTYVASCLADATTAPSFEEYYKKHLEDKIEWTSPHEIDVEQWLSINRDSREETMTWEEYLNSDHALRPLVEDENGQVWAVV
ncbi:hypothetical protein IFR04_014109 [Cadophora malorum]|uniref:Uncharacterized protein n=1 Tax=Cadophora malorum TaxID=108018 RepID=A0A8H7W574_9HELO|nr:hypothetical protein IFR04_014109 [Cadophora malorum]|tara:strand:- start:681 stop:1157 length:477 start_codon:yes stop_codon:yes gene_type:complete